MNSMYNFAFSAPIGRDGDRYKDRYMRRIFSFSILLFLAVLSVYGQKMKVDSFTHDPSDLSARLDSIVRDLNGNPCALLKVMVMDDITHCEGGNVGPVVAKHIVKYIYVSPTARYVQLEFKYHFPLTITFADYGFRSLTSLATYEVAIVDAQNNNPQPVMVQHTSSPPASADQAGVGKAKEEFEVNGVKFNMIRVEGGTFQMGATSEMKKPSEEEKPVHSVTLSTYYIGETEVTQALWQAVMGSNPSHFNGGGNLPVEDVSWDDCQEFISKLNQLTGMTFSLPTEAQWEYAARGGNKSRHTKYSGSKNIKEVAWYDGNSGSKTHPVGQKQSNELGLYDMSGNVWEWCSDWYELYSDGSQTNPTGPDSGFHRVLRGGSWYSSRYCRSSYRYGGRPSYRLHTFGFRLALLQ